MYYKTSDWRTDGAYRKRPCRDSQRVKVYHGTRYNLIRLGEGWVVTDLYPQDKDYIFQKNGRRIYCRKILLETTEPEVAREYAKLAEQLDADWASGKKKVPKTVDI